MHGEVVAVVGAQYGSEAKGAIVNHIASRFGVQQSKHSLRRRHRLLQRVVLVREILQRLIEPPNELQEGRDCPDRNGRCAHAR